MWKEIVLTEHNRLRSKHFLPAIYGDSVLNAEAQKEADLIIEGKKNFCGGSRVAVKGVIIHASVNVETERELGHALRQWVNEGNAFNFLSSQVGHMGFGIGKRKDGNQWIFVTYYGLGPGRNMFA